MESVPESHESAIKNLTTAQMREADRRCIEELGIPGAVLMNNAGRAVFEHIQRGPVGIACGKGNNGGDGFVVARLCLLAGFEPRVVLFADRGDIRGDAAVFLHVYEKLGGRIQEAKEAETAGEAVKNLSDCAILVDALLGTGTRGELHGAIRAAIEAWPPVHTISIDVPSGMNADTGAVCSLCVRADVTVTFAFAKKGFLNPAARHWLGTLHVADIGIPQCCAEDSAWNALRASRET